MANGMNKTKEKVWECKSGLMEASMKDSGLKIKLILMADLYILLGIVILVNGNSIKLMELVLFIFLMVENILGLGKMIYNMDLELRHGPILQSMKAGLRMGKDIILVLFTLLMEVNTLENFLKIKFKAKELTNGKMAESFKAFGIVAK